MGGAALLPGWPAILSAALAAMILAAYFLLGLVIIHAISRHWNGRSLLLVTLYFLIFVMAWVIIPVSLMGLLDTRFDFRKLNHRPDKPSNLEGDQE
jgi:glucan phosphoethanolaminetransferase (alkaline phosphatase superfamily)